jgi:inorganic pyrophosphatase
MDFWSRLDNLLAIKEIYIDRPKGSAHPRFPDLIYPLDYGYLKNTSGGDGNEIDVWRGSNAGDKLAGIICTVDIIKNDAEIKLLVGCTDAEIEIIEKFHNVKQMSGIIVRRPART